MEIENQTGSMDVDMDQEAISEEAVPEEALSKEAVPKEMTKETKETTDTNDTNDSPPRTAAPFPFDRLPAELQTAIWTDGLPARVVELCPQAGRPLHPVAVYAAPRFAYNRQRPATRVCPPVLAQSCFAARAAAAQTGRWMHGANNVPVWVDLSRDTILLNAERVIDYVVLQPEGAPPSRHSLLAGIQRASGRVDLAKAAHEAPTEAVIPPVDPLSPASPFSGPFPPPALHQHQLLAALQRARGGVAVPAELLRSHLAQPLFHLLAGHYLPLDHWAGPRMVFFDQIELSGTRAAAVRSGLFGWSPDEDLFFVRLADTDRLRHIYQLARASDPPPGSSGGDPGAATSLRIGNAGFLCGLLQHRQEAQNRRLLEEAYMHGRLASGLIIPPAHQAMLLRQMPPLEQAVLFRFHEIDDAEAARRAAATFAQRRWEYKAAIQS